MNELTVSSNHLPADRKRFLDENRNLTLEQATDREFLQIFFMEKIYSSPKQLSPNTIKAYHADAKTLLEFLAERSLSLRSLGYPEVKAYNEYIVQKYAAKTAIRKLEFFRRLLDFGYETNFYPTYLSTWINKPRARKGHYMNDKKQPNRFQVRELSKRDALEIIGCFPEIVTATTNRTALKRRNLLIGYLLYMTGLRASELLNLNWGSFRYSRSGHMYVDVIGKGNKERTIPLRKEIIELLFEYRKSVGESTELDINDASPLFFAIYNKKLPCKNKKRLTYPALYKIVKQAVELAGKRKEISPHWFRHTFVTTLLENDVPLAIVKDWAGHADISTTNIYLERINRENTHVHMEKDDLFK